jgi:hypothetical protein
MDSNNGQGSTSISLYSDEPEERYICDSLNYNDDSSGSDWSENSQDLLHVYLNGFNDPGMKALMEREWIEQKRLKDLYSEYIINSKIQNSFKNNNITFSLLLKNLDILVKFYLVEEKEKKKKKSRRPTTTQNFRNTVRIPSSSISKSTSGTIGRKARKTISGITSLFDNEDNLEIDVSKLNDLCQQLNRSGSWKPEFMGDFVKRLFDNWDELSDESQAFVFRISLFYRKDLLKNNNDLLVPFDDINLDCAVMNEEDEYETFEDLINTFSLVFLQKTIEAIKTSVDTKKSKKSNLSNLDFLNKDTLWVHEDLKSVLNIFYDHLKRLQSNNKIEEHHIRHLFIDPFLSKIIRSLDNDYHFYGGEDFVWDLKNTLQYNFSTWEHVTTLLNHDPKELNVNLLSLYYFILYYERSFRGLYSEKHYDRQQEFYKLLEKVHFLVNIESFPQSYNFINMCNAAHIEFLSYRKELESFCSRFGLTLEKDFKIVDLQKQFSQASRLKKVGRDFWDDLYKLLWKKDVLEGLFASINVERLKKIVKKQEKFIVDRELSCLACLISYFCSDVRSNLFFTYELNILLQDIRELKSANDNLQNQLVDIYANKIIDKLINIFGEHQGLWLANVIIENIADYGCIIAILDEYKQLLTFESRPTTIKLCISQPYLKNISGNSTFAKIALGYVFLQKNDNKSLWFAKRLLQDFIGPEALLELCIAQDKDDYIYQSIIDNNEWSIVSIFKSFFEFNRDECLFVGDKKEFTDFIIHIQKKLRDKKYFSYFELQLIHIFSQKSFERFFKHLDKVDVKTSAKKKRKKHNKQAKKYYFQGYRTLCSMMHDLRSKTMDALIDHVYNNIK